MSRIGKKPIAVPKGVTVTISDRELEVKGAKGVLKTPIPEGVNFKLENDQLTAERAADDQAAVHGLARALANNAIVGVTEGFSKQMDVVGVGYKAEVQGRKIVFALGYFTVDFSKPLGCYLIFAAASLFFTVNLTRISERDRARDINDVVIGQSQIAARGRVRDDGRRPQRQGPATIARHHETELHAGRVE